MKEKLQAEIDRALEDVKDYTRFIKLFGDSAEAVITRLNLALRQISMLLKMNEIKDVAHPDNQVIDSTDSGYLVKIRPCAKEFNDKTFLGIYIGEVALGSSLKIFDDKIQLNFSGHNPAIFIPEIKKIVYGCESWWKRIDNENDLKDISDNNIQNVWYVKLLNEINKE